MTEGICWWNSHPLYKDLWIAICLYSQSLETQIYPCQLDNKGLLCSSVLKKNCCKMGLLETTFPLWDIEKNPAYKTHWLSQRVRIVPPIPKIWEEEKH